MFVGYARVSTEDQNLNLQRDALKAAGCATIYEEKVSGSALQGRSQLPECLRALRPGDTLMVWKLDRLGRSIRDLINTVADLEKRSVNFRSLTDDIDTSTPNGAFTFHLFSALAQLERSRISERTKAGLQAARARGRLGGAKPKTTSKQDGQMHTLWQAHKHSAKEIAEQFSVSVPTFFRRMAAFDKAASAPLSEKTAKKLATPRTSRK